MESAAPDLSTVIESIIKHGETIDEHYAAKGLNELGIVDTESFVPLGASAHLKIQSLPILDNLVGSKYLWSATGANLRSPSKFSMS